MIFKFFRNKYEKRAEEDFSKIKNNYCQEKNFAIICIDVQENFVEGIHPIKKKEILIEYINKLIKLCEQNKILFLDIKLGEMYGQVLENNKNIYIKNSTGLLEDHNLKPKILQLLEQNKIEVLYIIGFNRNTCVERTIFNFLEEKNYKVVTSFLGTATSISSYYRYKDKYKNKDISLSNKINLLLKNGVIILDYYGEDKK